MRLWALGQLEIETESHHDQDDEEPDDADLAAAALGLRIESERPAGAEVDVYLWPECLRLWLAWQNVQTQWQLGPSGHRVGLNHVAVLADLRALGFGPGKRRSLHRAHGDITAMERAALGAWFEQIEREQRSKGR